MRPPLLKIEFPHHEFDEVDDVSGTASRLHGHPTQYKSFRFDPTALQTLVFQPFLPNGYFGNWIVLTAAVAPAEKMLSFAVGRVQEAVRRVTDGYMRSVIDYFEETRARPSLSSTLVIATWSRLCFHAADFGWGEPLLSGPKEATLSLCMALKS
ncbi:hypothetical protein V2J09_021906 [Rumex salicifolius]